MAGVAWQYPGTDSTRQHTSGSVACRGSHGTTRAVERLRADRDTTSEVLDKVESIIAFQKAELDLLEGMKNPGTISRARAEEMLKDMLGSVYNRLCHDARHALMSAEQVFRYPDFASVGDTIFNIAKAFEVQLKEVVLPLLAEYLTALGIKTFPRKIKPKGRPIIGDGVLDKNRSLGHIKEALNCADPELVEFCMEHGLDLIKLRESIEQILPYRNRTGHGEALTLPKVTELRERWLGVDVRDGGIFRFVITDRFDPRLVRF